MTGTTVGITDDDVAVGHDGGVTTVTAGLSHASGVATTVGERPDSPAVAGDYEISADGADDRAGQTASTGAVTFDNDVDTRTRLGDTAGNTTTRALGR